jgi:hypothetical protein
VSYQKPGGPQVEAQSWKEILAQAFTTFFLSPPANYRELIRRICVTLVLAMLSGGSFILMREPDVLRAIVGTPVEEQNMEQRMVGARREKAHEALEEWFYSHRPRGLMLVAWSELKNVNGIWVKPSDAMRTRIGIRPLSNYLRDWVGPFIFGECVVAPYEDLPNARIAVCPILTSSDVWGYVGAVYMPGDFTDEEAAKTVKELAAVLIDILY